MDARADRATRARARLGLFELYRRGAQLVWVETQGTSMRPSIAPGSWMQVQFGASPRHVGEIVLFERQGKVVAHRVIGVKAGVLLTKGDSLSYFDSPVQEAEVLGVVRARRTASGRTSFGCRGRSAHFAALLSGLHGRITGRLRAGRDHP